MEHEWRHGVAAAVDVALLARFYERFADHAVEIGRRVVFEATGTRPAEQDVGTNYSVLIVSRRRLCSR